MTGINMDCERKDSCPINLGRHPKLCSRLFALDMCPPPRDPAPYPCNMSKTALSKRGPCIGCARDTNCFSHCSKKKEHDNEQTAE